MKISPGFLNELQLQLESVPFEILESINRPGGLEISGLIDVILNPKDYTVYMPHQIDPNVIVSFEDIDEKIRKIGKNIIDNDQVAFCILFEDEVNELTFLTKKLEALKHLKEIWLMIPTNTIPKIYFLLSALEQIENVKVITYYESFALTPDNRLIGNLTDPQLSICGKGDVIPALQHNGLLEDFISKGGKYIYVSPSKIFLQGPDAAVLGQHATGKIPVTCEVVDRHPNDRFDILCNHSGFDQLVSQHRLMYPADPDCFSFVGIDSYVFDANLDFNTLIPSWHRMKRNLNNKIVVSYQRSLCDLTATFQTQYVKIPRDSRLTDQETSD